MGKNKVFSRIKIGKITGYPNEELFIKKALKSLEKTVEMTINPFDDNLQLFAEAVVAGSGNGKVLYDLILYPEKGKKIMGMSVHGKLNGVYFMGNSQKPLTFIYGDGKERYSCKVMLKSPG